jgi:hypothetical protein
MSVTSPSSLQVTVWTLWHGTEVSGPGTFELLDDEVRIEVPGLDAELLIPFTRLDGARIGPGHLTLYAGSGDVIELDGSSDLEKFGRLLKTKVCVLPEVTLPLRGLGSARAHPGSDHDRFFAPLLSARRSAQRAGDPGARLAAMRAPALAAEVERISHEFALERFPESAADRRALEAELADLAAPVRASLDRLADVASRAASAGDDTAFVSWRAWAKECRALFASADRFWLAAAPLLAERRVPDARSRRTGWLWRRGQSSPAASKPAARRSGERGRGREEGRPK